MTVLKNKRQKPALIGALFCILFPVISFAEAENTSLSEVTVTAAREAQSGLARSISVIKIDKASQNIHINEVLDESAGTWISRGNGQEHLTAIRSPVLVGAGSCSAFLMLEDNLSIRSPAFCNVNQLFDLNYEQAQKIEVLKGPGTAFQGSGAMHGTINLISPDFSKEPSSNLAFSRSNHQFNQILLDHREKDLVWQGNFVHDDGFKDDANVKQQKLRIKKRQTNKEWYLVHHLNIMNLEQETAGYISGKDAYKDASLKKANNNPDAFRNAQAFRYYLNAVKETSRGELNLSPYVRWNQMDFLMHFIPGTPLEKNGHSSLGLQSFFIPNRKGELGIKIGFDFDLSTGYLQQTQYQTSFAPFPIGEHYDYDVSVLTSAFFTQFDYSLTQKFKMSAGLRFEQSYYDYENHLSDGIVSCAAADQNLCRYVRPAGDYLDFLNFSPELRTSYHLNSSSMAYLVLSQGFRTPHTSELFRLESGQTLANIDSEEINAVELGFKSTVLESLRYSLSIFQMQKDNVILKTAARQNVDGQKTKHQGVELEASYQASENLSLRASLSYAIHQYDSNVQVFASNETIIKGNDIDTSPRHLHFMSLDYELDGTSLISLESNHIGNYYLESGNNISYPGHDLIHLNYQRNLNKDWLVAVKIHNALNEDYADRADVEVLDGSTERYFIGEPRNLRIKIAKSFGN